VVSVQLQKVGSVTYLSFLVGEKQELFFREGVKNQLGEREEDRA
jgi:hypothetical protein